MNPYLCKKIKKYVTIAIIYILNVDTVTSYNKNIFKKRCNRSKLSIFKNDTFLTKIGLFGPLFG